MSPAQPQVAYIHFVGVRADHRQTGLARALDSESRSTPGDMAAESYARSLLQATPPPSASTNVWALPSARLRTTTTVWAAGW